MWAYVNFPSSDCKEERRSREEKEDDDDDEKHTHKHMCVYYKGCSSMFFNFLCWNKAAE